MKMATIEKSMPPITPMANENQNGSLLPSNKKGINPNTVLRIVSKVGTIFLL